MPQRKGSVAGGESAAQGQFRWGAGLGILPLFAREWEGVTEWSTRAQLEAPSAARRKPALDRENDLLSARYAGQYVAYTDDWNDRYELMRPAQLSK